MQTYPHLSLEQVAAALVYYDANQGTIDAELEADDSLYDELKARHSVPDSSA